MRKVASVKNNHPDIKRVIVHETENGVYVFPCSSETDGSAIGDEWFQSLKEADEFCLAEYAINTSDWEFIDEPLEFCQQDWIEPVRIKDRNIGKPEWGKFERLENGVWIEFIP